MKFYLTKVSRNSKTGPIPVSTSPRQTCPDSCPLKTKGCYAESGPINIHWDLVSRGERGVSWERFLAQIRKLRKGTLWRHDQAGDLQGENERINAKALAELVSANKGRKGFTYTHYPVLAKDVIGDFSPQEKEEIAYWNRTNIEAANKNGFTINLSANGPRHAEELKELNIAPVATIVEEDFQTNDKIVVCPATRRDDVNCSNCQLCQKQHSKVVGFPVHGSRKRAAQSQIC